MEKKVEVLGTEYTVKVSNSKENSALVDCGGYCDETTKEIIINDFAPERGLAGSKQNMDAQISQSIRHELVHAFLFESGLAQDSDWAFNEEIVDWIARQGPKIVKAWNDMGALEPAISKEKLSSTEINDAIFKGLADGLNKERVISQAQEAKQNLTKWFLERTNTMCAPEGTVCSICGKDETCPFTAAAVAIDNLIKLVEGEG